MEGILTFIIAIAVVFGIIFLVMTGAQKYGGISFSRRGHLQEDIRNNEIYSKFAQETNDKLKKENPALYIKATENLKRKKYAFTYSNFNDELTKIKKKEPEWVKKEAEKQAKINLEEYRRKSANLREKYNEKEVNTDLLYNPKYKPLWELYRKKKRFEKLEIQEIEIIDSTEYKDFEILVKESTSENSLVDKMKYYDELLKLHKH
ncbi:hypothetical protein VDP25_17090 [Winogradskyella sp. ECml5-4]|uniref:hypothetical protein n=1 Tax=Winogradskyella sp. ECml5-4 TaxID=3110975 RepID=UPI002FEFDF9F